MVKSSFHLYFRSSHHLYSKLEGIYKNKYKINLDHQILSDHGVFYPQALYNDLTFELTLAQAVQVVRGSDASKLVYYQREAIMRTLGRSQKP